MSLQLSVPVRNAQGDAIETVIGVSPLLNLYSGSLPASCSASIGGAVVLAIGALPSDWLANAAAGVKAKAGTWTLTGQAAAGSGTVATFFRFYDGGGSVCHAQGTVTITGSGGDLQLDNPSIANGQAIQIATFNFNAQDA